MQCFAQGMQCRTLSLMLNEDGDIGAAKRDVAAEEDAPAIAHRLVLVYAGQQMEEGRMLDVDMSLLGEAMLKPHPFALLDLSYNALGDDGAV